MARPARNEIAVAEFSKAMSKLTRRQPRLTSKDVELALFRDHGLRVSEESIRKALHGDIDPTACAIELLKGLSVYFNAPHSALGHQAAERLDRFEALFRPRTPAGLGGSHSGHKTNSSDDATILPLRSAGRRSA